MRENNIPHGSYLQGMETGYDVKPGSVLGDVHGSYLQGMETP